MPPEPILWLIFLLVSSLLAFRSVREIWFLAVVSVFVIADGWESTGRNARGSVPLRSRIMVGVWVLAVVLASCRHYGLSNDVLEIQTAGTFPEAAVRFVEQHRLGGPLFNDLSWGGFLLWRLPQLPVALDGFPHGRPHRPEDARQIVDALGGRAIGFGEGGHGLCS